MDLAGKRVAFTGRLASMTLLEAADLVRARGGAFASQVSRQTAVLVVGQDGWPLRKDGQLSKHLEAARVLQAAGHAIAIVREEDFLRDLAIEGEHAGVHKRFTLAQLTRLLKIPRDRLRAWIRAGWLLPIETIEGVRTFDFQQVAGIRSLWNLVQSGVSTEKIRRSLDQLGAWVGVEPARLLEGGDRLLVRVEQGLVDASGQLHFDFEDASPALPALAPRDDFESGCALEAAGRLEEAADAYRAALAWTPTAETHFNLGNVLFQLGGLADSCKQFERAIELKPDFHEAWNNLGIVQAEMSQTSAAWSAFRRAILVCQTYADAYYNLADLLDETGRCEQARLYWRSYLQLEPLGEWARHARARLEVS